MIRGSQRNKHVLQTRALLPTAFNGAFSRLLDGGERQCLPTVAPQKQERNNNKKHPKAPKHSKPRHFTQVSYDLFSNKNKARRQPLGKKAIPSLPGDVYMLTLRMDALAVWFVQFCSAFKKI